ncbi:carotenoid oxygenase family protein [Leptolyngbya sp. KIOST-1]|uniref:carotenoid oxygenase family protein n=1 Tax=Leptolyngbya sp. KIOST-1 TaxID=1229172 RepID=UPI000AEB0F53|nr:carotenoid oxygenase family protein [Leptolyngbya sp. KIOST-1]
MPTYPIINSPTMTAAAGSEATTFSVEDWSSGYRSQPNEHSYWITDIEGNIPADLEGTLFRNGPGLLDVNGHSVKHPFDGDGMISSIVIRNGKAFFRNRFVRTAGYVAEQAAQKPLFRGVFGTQKPGGPLTNAFDLSLKNIANTHIVYWANKLLALWEAAEPHRLDPSTLETLGLDYLNGLIAPGGSFTAHPKIDPGHHGDQRLVGFSLKTGLSSTITLHELDAEGNAVCQHRHTIPGFAFIHDFALTPNYAIFFQNPVSFGPIPFLLGFKGAAECIRFNPKEPTKILVVPRNGDPMQVIETDPCFVFHHANAFERDGQIVIDSICYDSFPSLDGTSDFREVDFESVPAGELWRFSLNMAAGTAEVSKVLTRCVEFPTLHPDYLGRPYRYLFIGTAHAAQGNAPLQALLKLDTHTGDTEVWSAAPRGFMGEPLFVPRPGGQGEDDGWVLVLMYNAERQCSDLVILAGQDIAAGPVARLKLPHHVPYGLHGSFVSQYFGPGENE